MAILKWSPNFLSLSLSGPGPAWNFNSLPPLALPSTLLSCLALVWGDVADARPNRNQLAFNTNRQGDCTSGPARRVCARCTSHTIKFLHRLSGFILAKIPITLPFSVINFRSSLPILQKPGSTRVLLWLVSP